MHIDWADGFNGAITVCDREGIIVYMNDFSIQQFEKYGGKQLLGSNLLDCHPEPSKTALKKMLQQAEENTYTTEEGGVKRMILQRPWMRKGEFVGVVELSFQLDENIPNHKR